VPKLVAGGKMSVENRIGKSDRDRESLRKPRSATSVCFQVRLTSYTPWFEYISKCQDLKIWAIADGKRTESDCVGTRMNGESLRYHHRTFVLLVTSWFCTNDNDNTSCSVSSAFLKPYLSIYMKLQVTLRPVSSVNRNGNKRLQSTP